MCGKGGYAWQGDMHGQGMHGGGGGGACMVGEMHGRGCVWQGGMCGGGYAWQGGLRALETATAASGTHYYYWNALFFQFHAVLAKNGQITYGVGTP